jgi:hypothetical protein
MPTDRPSLGGYEGDGSRLGQLLTLLGLTGFAVSQPLLAVAGENPSMFTFAGVRGTGLVAFALLVAFVPPLLLWLAVVLIGSVNRRAGDVAFVLFSALLVGTIVSQWVWSAGLDARWARGLIGVLAAAAFGALLVRVRLVAAWTRYTALLPILAVVLMLTSSPSSGLLSSLEDASPVESGNALPSVVFLMLDEFPLQAVLDDDGGIDADRFPNLAALAAESTWYPNYTVTATVTTRSVPSILTGRLPSGGPPLASAHPDNLFSLLAPTHHLTTSETVTELCAFSTCGIEGAERSSGRGIPSLLDQMSDVWQERVGLRAPSGADLDEFAEEAETVEPTVEGPVIGDEEEVAARPARVTQFLDALTTSPSPSLGYLHLMLPHRPWRFAPDGQPYGGIDAQQLAVEAQMDLGVDEWTAALVQQTFLLQAQYTDRLVGEVLDGLRDAGRFEDTLIVVTSDHGMHVSTDPSEGRSVGADALDDVAFVPLIIKSPGQQEGRVDDSNLMGMDLLPTIAAEVGVDLAWEVDGFAAGSPEVAARDGSKTIYAYDGIGMSDTGREVVQFDAADHQPSAVDGLVSPLRAGDHVFAGLLRPLDADGWLGRAVDDLEVGAGGTAAIPFLAALADDPDRWAPVDQLAGQVDGPAEGEVLLVALDGTIESGAPVLAGGAFRLLLPPEASLVAATDIRLFTIDDEDLIELDVSS